VGPLARAISFEAGLHLSIFDFKGAEALQRESRELAAGVGFTQPFISSGIDMLLTLARDRNPGPAEVLMKETTIAAATNPWHRNLWKVRLSQARAEIALARGDRNTAIEEATTAKEQARALGRPKYEALAHIARAHALGGLDRMPEAIADAHRAIAVARRTDDPALLLQALDVLLFLEGNDEALAEARLLIHRIAGALTNDTMRYRFQSSEIVHRVQQL
jgi:ATP/maltotriose-dependent transcriptional regulator MalT